MDQQLKKLGGKILPTKNRRKLAGCTKTYGPATSLLNRGHCRCKKSVIPGEFRYRLSVLTRHKHALLGFPFHMLHSTYQGGKLLGRGFCASKRVSDSKSGQQPGHVNEECPPHQTRNLPCVRTRTQEISFKVLSAQSWQVQLGFFEG